MNKKFLAIAALCCLHLAITLLLGDIFETETSMLSSRQPVHQQPVIGQPALFDAPDDEFDLAENEENIGSENIARARPAISRASLVFENQPQRRTNSTKRLRSRNSTRAFAPAEFTDTVIFVQTKGMAESGRSTGPRVLITDSLKDSRQAPKKDPERRRAMPVFTQPVLQTDSLVSRL